MIVMPYSYSEKSRKTIEKSQKFCASKVFHGSYSYMVSQSCYVASCINFLRIICSMILNEQESLHGVTKHNILFG